MHGRMGIQKGRKGIQKQEIVTNKILLSMQKPKKTRGVNHNHDIF